MYAHIKKFDTIFFIVLFFATVPIQSACGMENKEKETLKKKLSRHKTVPIKIPEKSKTKIFPNRINKKSPERNKKFIVILPKSNSKNEIFESLIKDDHSKSPLPNKMSEFIDKVQHVFEGTEEQKKSLCEGLLECMRAWESNYKFQKEENFLNCIERVGIKIKNQYVIFILACCYHTGIETFVDPKKALSLYCRASKFGSLLNEKTILFVQEQAKSRDEVNKRRAQRCLNNLGCAYVNSKNDKEDSKKGLRFLEEASNLGYLPATFNLANSYHLGRGVKINLEKARELYKKAVLDGFGQAQEGLNKIKELKQINAFF